MEERHCAVVTDLLSLRAVWREQEESTAGGRQTARLPGLSAVLRQTSLHFQRYPAVHREADAVAGDSQDQSVPLVVRQVGAAEAPVLRGPSVTSEKEVQAFS